MIMVSRRTSGSNRMITVLCGRGELGLGRDPSLQSQAPLLVHLGNFEQVTQCHVNLSPEKWD